MSKQDNELAGSNILLKQGTGEFEMLTFSLGKEVFGVNVAKVTEIIRANYHITPIPNSQPSTLGIFMPRDFLLTAIDLNYCLYGKSNENSKLLYKKDLSDEDNLKLKNTNFIICSFNGIKQAWLVDSVKSIIRLPWADIQSPSKTTTSEDSFVTGIYLNEETKELIQIIDFEAIMVRINPDTGLTIKNVDEIKEKDIEKNQNTRVWIADDSKMLNKLITDAVSKVGYKITSFVDGQKLLDSLNAVKKDKEKHPDIIITDVEMPLLDGMTLCKTIKEDDFLKSIPVLIFSSLVDDAMKRKCETVHANRAFSKPEIGQVIEYINIAIDEEKNKKELVNLS